MEMLEEKNVRYDDDIHMAISMIRDDKRYKAAGDRGRQWLLHYFTYQRQVTQAPSTSFTYLLI